ncbi:MAG TPA: LLM class F420-dependent oxidoreductase [Solirubrobacteraceae bacterium]|nr:LLM class F420-dependent oxidoreductase [Solirubrobacteraceae bacterium]
MTARHTRPIRIGLQIAQYGADWPAFLDAAREAEALGADALFNWDHFFGPGETNVPSYECWTMLAAWATATSRIDLGPLVNCIGYRNPDLVADMARTVDHIAGGRTILGLGSGFKQRDYREYGYRFGSVADRVNDLESGILRIQKRLKRLDPPPLRPIPLLIAGSGERRTLRLVAEHADIWHTFADADDFVRKSQILDDHCGRIGRDPEEIERSVLVAGDPAASGPQQLDLGVTFFIVSVKDLDLDPVRQWVRWRDEHNSRLSTP